MSAPSGPRSGRHGSVAVGASALHSIRNWNLNAIENHEARVLSSTRAGTMRFPGVADWNGSFEGFGGTPPVFPGDQVALSLFAGPDTGVFGATGLVYFGNAIIDSLTITWQWQPTVVVSWSANYSANGCLAYNTDEYYDTILECVAQACSMKAMYQDECSAGSGSGTFGASDGEFTELANVESITLTFTANNLVVVNSSTNCCTEREPGTLDWTLAIVDQEQYPILDYDTYYHWHLYTTATEYWCVAYSLLQDVSNVRVDMESGAIITKTNTLAMASHACCTGDQSSSRIGVVTDPAGATHWPGTL